MKQDILSRTSPTRDAGAAKKRARMCVRYFVMRGEGGHFKTRRLYTARQADAVVARLARLGVDAYRSSVRVLA